MMTAEVETRLNAFLMTFDKVIEGLWKAEYADGFIDLARILEREARIAQRNAEILTRARA